MDTAPDAETAVELAQWLCSPAAREPRAEAVAAVAAAHADPLASATRLRSRASDLSPAQAAAVLEQAALQRTAHDRYGIVGDLLLTRDGLEQATRPEVAARRARRILGAGARRVLDLTAGLGMDARAMAAAGLTVTAIERDSATAAFLAYNCPGVEVQVGDAVALLPTLLATLHPDDVVFVDPARREAGGPRDRVTGRARPERDPERWSPRWSQVASIPHGRVLAKLAPGFTPPEPWEAEWVSVDRTVVECCATSWPLSGVPRSAVILGGSTTTVVARDPRVDAVRAAELGAWVAEPDPAVLRADAALTLAASEGLAPLDAASTWLTGEHSSTSPALRCYQVRVELTGSVRQQRRTLADLGVHRATVKSRDVDIDPRTALRSLGLSEGPEHALVLTRRDGRVITLLTEPARARAR